MAKHWKSSFLNDQNRCKRSSASAFDCVDNTSDSQLDTTSENEADDCEIVNLEHPSVDENPLGDMSECSISSLHSSGPPPKQRRKTMISDRHGEKRSHSQANKSRLFQRAHTSEVMDSEIAFGIAVTQRLKRLPARQSSVAQIRIQQLLHEVEFESDPIIHGPLANLPQSSRHSGLLSREVNHSPRQTASRNTDVALVALAPHNKDSELRILPDSKNFQRLIEADDRNSVSITDVPSHSSSRQSGLIESEAECSLGQTESPNSDDALAPGNKDLDIQIPTDSKNFQGLIGIDDRQLEPKNLTEVNSSSQFCSEFDGHPQLRTNIGSNSNSQFRTETDRQLLETILRTQDDICQRVVSIESIVLKVFMKLDNNGSPVTEEDLPPLPCRQTADLLFLEDWIKDEANKDKFISYLSMFGGTNKTIAYNVRQIMGKFISNELASQVNWSGANNKLKFRNLSLAKIVFGAVRCINTDAKVHDIDDVMKNWFRYSKDRGGGRSKRKTMLETGDP